MEIRQKRIAPIAMVLLLLTCGAVWWWFSVPSKSSAASQHAGQVATPPGSAKTPASGNEAAIAHVDASMAACRREVATAFNARALALRQKQDAPSQLAYALAVPVDPSLDAELRPEEYQQGMAKRQNEIQAALLRAAALAPDDPDVLWLAMSLCGYGDECRAVQGALLAAEPDNMAVWLWELNRAKRRGDAEAARIAFERAATATRYDIHSGATHEAMLQGYAGLAMPATCQRAEVKLANAFMREMTGAPENTVETGMLDHALALAALNANLSRPPYNDVRQPCTPALNQAMTPTLRETCKRIHSRLAEGGTLMDQIIATEVMVELTADSPQAAAWRERYRRNRWLMEQQREPAILSLHRIEDYADGEVQRMQATLEAARWPPPADWLPANNRDRSLILTGRPPQENRRN